MKKLVHQRNPCQSQEAGYALIESLIAIIVVAILMTAVTPMIVFSVGTRMQAKRIQLATQASQSYLTALKNDPVGLAPGNETFAKDDFTKFRAPDKSELKESGDNKCLTEDGYCADQVLYCVNFDETPGCQTDSMVDMVVQPIGFFSPDSNDPSQADPEKGYNLEIRVYRANSFADDVDPLKNDEVDNSVAQALGNRTLPLFKTATFITPASENTELYNSFCKNLGGCK
ncbi:MAG: hormogonium polysaccharide secretion pseudopilin HpsB [Lyngbya sp.]|nr:hormogonium polysaccharide secretion pseudopilin HpsB [Lyngbya sp.]